jgi:ZU5 domain
VISATVVAVKKGLAVLAGAAIVVACSVQTIFPGGTAPAPGSASQIVGAGGGIVTTNDGTSLFIPPGALTADVTITIALEPAAASLKDARPLNAGHVFGPAGQTFLKPVCITLSFEPGLLPQGTTEANVVVYATGQEEVHHLHTPGAITTGPSSVLIDDPGYEPVSTMTSSPTQVTGMTFQFGTVVAAYGKALEIDPEASDASCDANQLDALEEQP